MVNRKTALKTLAGRVIRKRLPGIAERLQASAVQEETQISAQTEMHNGKAHLHLSGRDLLLRHYGAPLVPAHYLVSHLLRAISENRGHAR